MKKIIMFCLAMLLLMQIFTGCASKQTQNLKIGMGSETTLKATDAEGDQNGSALLTVTSASVVMDEQGRIVKCFVDATEYTISYTADGKAADGVLPQTKYQQGNAYGMKEYGGAKKEWYEQADAFCALVIGKTEDEVKSLVAADGKSVDDVIQAGCTISISDFVKAIENAIENAK